ncbi:hypothetical protein [Phenylobacterium sp.]|uniref:hypothetical protein n=1 Tax=Phenylobacterium sp. TaxID=1871053 RepID=UPI0035B4B962
MRPAKTSPAFGPVVSRIRRELAAYDLIPATARDIAEARDFAADLIGPAIVSAEALQRVHERSGAGLFLAREEGTLTGVLAFVLLNRAGLDAVWAETFEAVDPAASHVNAAGEDPAALYGWGVAATTKPSAARLIEGARAMWAGAVMGLPYFARPTTPKGERLMRERLNFEDCPGSTTGLVWLPPDRVRKEAA